MNRRDQKRLECLERRRDYLAGLIEASEANSYDLHEHSALSWAIERLRREEATE